MNKLSVPSLLEAQADIQTAKASQSVILVSAWLGTLPLSRLPQIVLSKLGVMNPSDPIYLRRYFQLRPGSEEEYQRWLPIIAAARLVDEIPELDSFLIEQEESNL